MKLFLMIFPRISLHCMLVPVQNREYETGLLCRTLMFFFFSFVISMSLGSIPTFLMALFVICVASLVGTAVMIFKKSRDKPAGYAVLVIGDQE